MKPDQLRDGQRVVIEFPRAGLDYSFTREGNAIWFGACVRAEVLPITDDEDVDVAHPQIKLKASAAVILYERLAALPK